MNSNYRVPLIALLLICIGLPNVLFSQDLNVKIGSRLTIKSEILNEDRNIIIHLPESYNKSKKSYPVIYRLDGNISSMLETVAVINRLSQTEEIIPDMIVVAIENIDRNKDMWPVKTKYYNRSPGAENFLNLIAKEIIPYIEQNYRTNEYRIICGQSLSGVFTLYALLSRPNLFNSYIISSGAFPDCEDYFNELSQKAFRQTNKFYDKDIFITNGLKDPLDPNNVYHKQIVDFSNKMKLKIGNQLKHKYLTYKNQGHVPFYSLYDGLKFIFIQE